MKFKLFCNHKYKFYGTKRYLVTNTTWCVSYHFVCPSCGEEFSVTGLKLSQELDEEKLNLRKLEVMGRLPNYDDNAELTIYTMATRQTSHKGKHVDALKRKYRKLGVDLAEIDGIAPDI